MKKVNGSGFCRLFQLCRLQFASGTRPASCRRYVPQAASLQNAECKLTLVLFVANTNAQTIVFTTDSGGTTTGELIEGTRNISLTTNVPEIAGLFITAQTDNPDHELNAISESFGINNLSTNSEPEAARFDPSEKMIFSFSENVIITNFDFRAFDAGESITVSVSGGAAVTIGYDDLENKTSDIAEANIYVPANAPVEIYTDGASQIGLESVGVEILNASANPTLSFSCSSGTSVVSVAFDEAAVTNYVLQACDNLLSNNWLDISAPFSADTNWVVATTNRAAYYRANAQ